jgi:hypothetical protein
MLHISAHTSPVTMTRDKEEDTKQFLRHVSRQLPCSICRNHMKHYLDEHLDAQSIASRDEYVTFLNDFHNAVNRRLGKPTWSRDAHCRRYAAKPPTPTARLWIMAAVMIAVTVAVSVQRRAPRCASRRASVPGCSQWVGHVR